MPPDRAAGPSAAHPAPWLETVHGDAAVLLIAPHGGHAGPAARAALHPKVNDLYTADITRELARRLGAAALINAQMDRNALDCNRLAQLTARAPWLIELIADDVERILDRHGHAAVLLIHGWNVIEPRLDFGLGVRSAGGILRPAGTARVSAGDDFINGPIARLAARLSAAGIIPTFGLRYPAGGAQNLLQAFTERHPDAELESVRRLARFARNGEIDAVQLELSVALRMPGRFRQRAIAEIERTFLPADRLESPQSRLETLRVERQPRGRSVTGGPRIASARVPPARIGIEFYDPRARLGGMASFDLGTGGAGARIMMLLGTRRVALFTGEGKLETPGDRLKLGPLSLDSGGGETTLRFHGAAVIVPDAAAYLSIERALASGALDEAVEVELTLKPALDFSAIPDSSRMFSKPDELARAEDLSGRFGRLAGRIKAGGIDAELNAVARMGLSMTGTGTNRFDARQTLWACLNGDGQGAILEARVIHESGAARRTARIARGGQWTTCEVVRLDLETESFENPPETIRALLALPSGQHAQLLGRVESFVPLSRPGANQARIYTSLGFATFEMGKHAGAGMFEYSLSSRTRAAGGGGDTGDD